MGLFGMIVFVVNVIFVLLLLWFCKGDVNMWVVWFFLCNDVIGNVVVVVVVGFVVWLGSVWLDFIVVFGIVGLFLYLLWVIICDVWVDLKVLV